MPGQRKRKRQQQDARQRAVLRTDPGAGDWQVAFETQEESAWHAYLRGLRAGPARADWAMTRADILCGRLVQPTTYRLSVFVLDTACEQ